MLAKMVVMARVRAPLGLIAAVAMLGSHWVAYLLAAPDPHARAHLLQITGHGYWPLAISLAIVGGVVGLGSFVSSRLGLDRRTNRQRIFAHALPRFLTLQIGGFVVLEVVERALAGHSVGLSTLVAAPLVIGLVIQGLAAFLSALLLVLVAFVVERFSTTPIPTPTASAPIQLVSLVHAPRLVPATGAHTLRGPPLRA
jgi:hypothetical protein